MAKALQTRSRAIRRAITTYNAAAAFDPPRPRLDWSNISHYGLVEQYAILRNLDVDASEKPWVQPVYREILKTRRRIVRAKEEILRCNVEARRLYTSIHDEAALFQKTLKQLRLDQNPILPVMTSFIHRRTGVNKTLLKRLRQIHALPGFSGDPSRGIRIGRTESTDDDITNLLPKEGDNEHHESSDEEDGGEPDDESAQQLHSVHDFMSNVRS